MIDFFNSSKFCRCIRDFFLRNMAQASQFSINPKVNYCCYRNMNMKPTSRSCFWIVTPHCQRFRWLDMFSAHWNWKPVHRWKPTVGPQKWWFWRSGFKEKGISKVYTECILYWVVVLNMFYFHPYLGKIPIFDQYFSKGLKPPASALVNFRGGNYLIITSAPEDQGSMFCGDRLHMPIFFPRILNLAKRF